ncbi:MAG: hypothetical protein IPP90_13800 [Gemmatimonadaceae bacterium]|nr:hypothetical protein [Gemmatimonadaceae bacterium]
MTGPVDSNGGCGVFNSISTPQAGLSGTLVKNGNVLTLTVAGGTMVFTAVTSTPSTFLGSFQVANEQDGSVILLQPDNTYLVVHTQVNGAGNTGISLGYERGCYTATGATLTFSLSASCRPDGLPALDLNGKAGFSDGGLGVPIPYVITGPNTITFGGDTFLIRILQN